MDVDLDHWFNNIYDLEFIFTFVPIERIASMKIKHIKK